MTVAPPRPSWQAAVPAEIPVEIPVEIPAESPVEAPGESPLEMPGESPLEVPGELPIEVPGTPVGMSVLPVLRPSWRLTGFPRDEEPAPIRSSLNPSTVKEEAAGVALPEPELAARLRRHVGRGSVPEWFLYPEALPLYPEVARQAAEG